MEFCGLHEMQMIRATYVRVQAAFTVATCAREFKEKQKISALRLLDLLCKNICTAVWPTKTFTHRFIKRLINEAQSKGF